MQGARKSAESIETISLELTNFTDVSLWHCIILAIWSFFGKLSATWSHPVVSAGNKCTLLGVVTCSSIFFP